MLMRDSKEGRKKEAESNKHVPDAQCKSHNNATHPQQSCELVLVPRVLEVQQSCDYHMTVM